MKRNTLYLFDVNAILLDNNLNCSTASFVPGFPEFLAKIGGDNIRIFVPAQDIAQLPDIERKLAVLNIRDKIAIVHTDDEILQHIAHSYAANHYLFIHRIRIQPSHCKKPTAVILIDKHDDLLPQKDCLNVQNYNEISYLF
ncbi:hypothetical protein [Necropsobacter rosorum]|uniref:hypothetical protein n=1 Tax=Necropsobacter rosorum TaxID=908285 RepID=UPI000509C7A1